MHRWMRHSRLPDYVRASLPYTALLTVGFAVIQVLRFADLSAFIGTYRHHEEKKQALRIRAYLVHELTKDGPLCALLCEVALWYSLISPTCRLDNAIFTMLEKENAKISSKIAPSMVHGIEELCHLVEKLQNDPARTLHFSESDLLNMITCVAMELVGGPRIKSQIGRKDVDLTDNATKSQLISDLHANMKHMAAYSLGDWFTFSTQKQREMFRKLEGRSIDGVSPTSSSSRRFCPEEFIVTLYGGFRSLQPVKSDKAEKVIFSNHCFHSLLLKQAQQQPQNEKEESLGFLRNPLQLFNVPVNSDFGTRLLQDKMAFDWVQRFATEEKNFFQSFAGVFTWLLERGYVGQELIDIYYKD